MKTLINFIKLTLIELGLIKYSKMDDSWHIYRFPLYGIVDVDIDYDEKGKPLITINVCDIISENSLNEIEGKSDKEVLDEFLSYDTIYDIVQMIAAQSSRERIVRYESIYLTENSETDENSN